ncbi:hypothetical protein ACGU38_10510, partial [Streptomyces rochei]
MTRRRKPTIRVGHRAAGWVLPDYTDLADCTTNYQRSLEGRPACTDTAVWKVVEDHGLHLTIGFYCDADLPAEHRRTASGPTPPPDACTCARCGSNPDNPAHRGTDA